MAQDSFALSCISLLSIVQGTISARTPLYFEVGTSGSLPCNITGVTTAYWEDDDEKRPIFTVSGQSEPLKTSYAGEIPKYNQYSVDYEPDSKFDLLVDPIQLSDDAGNYDCEDIESGVIVSYSINAEARAAVSFTCLPPCPVNDDTVTITENTTCTCTCVATGGYPGTLRLEWNDVGVMGQQRTSFNTSNPDGSYDFRRDITLAPSKDDTIITCSIVGYTVSAIQSSPDIEASMALKVQYTSCMNGGTFRNNPPGSQRGYFCECVEFYIGPYCEKETACLASPCENGGICQYSSTGDDYSCDCRGSYSGRNCTLPPPAPATTDETPRSPGKGEICAGHVAGLAVEAVLITILAGTVGWLVYTLRRNSAGKHRTSDPVDGFAGANNSAYLDLHERIPANENQIPSSAVSARDVMLISTLPGRGLMTYQQAILTTNTGNTDAVAKSLSGKAFLETEKIWSSEISTLQNLSKQATVVEILGWCHSVPQLLLLEYVNGGNLMEHLRENFSSQKVHQYGNTKQKRFKVSETGDVGNLPRYALDVAKGLKFLRSNQFIHPGVRAQKVLVDLSGRCKIYDFVSSSRAKDLMKLLWIETAPYQWMPPEYLFLGSVSAPGDVWSFGVLMWEIFSYGSPPYLGKDRSEVEASVRREERLAMPQNCPGAVWQLMNRCWDQSTDTRPAIGEVASSLAAMCNEDKEYDEIPTMKTEV